MPALPAGIRAASPLNASDDSRLLFTNNTDETLTRALNDTPSDFGTMATGLQMQVEYRQQGRSDDTLRLLARIVNGATILAADDAAGVFELVSSSVTNTTDTTTTITFSFVNTTANKATWDGASVELQQDHQQSMAADGCHIEVDTIQLVGNYNIAVNNFQEDLQTSIVATTTESEVQAMVEDLQTSIVASTTVGDTYTPAGVGDPGYLLLDGAGDYLLTADKAALDITGDITLVALLAPDDVTPASNMQVINKFPSSGSGRSYALLWRADQLLQLNVSTTGTTNTHLLQSTATVPATDGGWVWIKAELDVDNGSGGYDCRFYYSADSPSTDLASVAWTQLGSTVSAAGTITIASGATDLNLGRFANGSGEYAGRIGGAWVISGLGVGGTIVADPDFRDNDQGWSGSNTASDDAGNSWDFFDNAVWIVPPGSVGYMTTGTASNVRAQTTQPATAWSTGIVEVITCVALEAYEFGSFGFRPLMHHRGQFTAIIRGAASAGDPDHLQLSWHDGASVLDIQANGTFPDDIVDRAWVWCRVVFNPNNGSNRVADFYYSFDDPLTDPASVSWTQMGTQVSSTTSTIRAAASTVTGIGGDSTLTGNSPANAWYAYGAIYVGGSRVADPDFRDADQGWDSPPATDSHSNSWDFINGAAWVAPTVGMGEDLSTSIVATTTISDVLGSSEALSTSVVATTTISDAVNSAESLTTSVTATTTAVDNISATEALTTSAVATTEVFDIVAGTEGLGTSIVATTTQNDSLGAGNSFEENLSTSIVATTTSEDRLSVSEGLATSIVATTVEADDLAMFESLVISIVGSSSSSESQGMSESLQTSIVSDDTMTDVAAYIDTLETDIVATTTSNDQVQGSFTESLSTTIVATTTSTDSAEYTDTLQTSISSTITAGEVFGMSEVLETSGSVTTTQSDVGFFVESLQSLIVGTTTSQDDVTGSFTENLSTSILASTVLLDNLASVESLASGIVGTTSILDAVARFESLQTSGTVITTIQDQAAYLETLLTSILATTHLSATMASDFVPELSFEEQLPGVFRTRQHNDFSDREHPTFKGKA